MMFNFLNLGNSMNVGRSEAAPTSSPQYSHSIVDIIKRCPENKTLTTGHVLHPGSVLKMPHQVDFTNPFSTYATLMMVTAHSWSF